MKYIASQFVTYLQHKGARRNVRALLRFFIVLVALIVTHSVLFHYAMLYEGQRHSWLTGFYWTLTVMSTLGFGDITFHSDVGRMFSVVVLLSGILFLLILMPFTLIQFFYAPWVEAQAAARAPRELPPETRGHVILTRHDAVTAVLIRKLEQFNYQYVLLAPDVEAAIRLGDAGVKVVIGQLDDPESYRRVRADQAALVATTQDDIINTTAAFAARQVAPNVQIVASAVTETAVEIMHRAGATTVLRLGDMMGKSLARCMVGGDAVTHVVGAVDELLLAEASAQRTPLVGRTLRENRLREIGVSVIGMWDRGKFQFATPDTVVAENAILLLGGSSSQFAAYDEHFAIYNNSSRPVVILGGGRVGQAAAHALQTRGVEWRMVDLVPGRVADHERAVVGDAGDPEVLRRAGIAEAPAVLITTHDDNLNIYLTIYCRSIRPDMQIISRCTLERNTDTLRRAGADLVLSYASMGAMSIFNLIKRSRIVSIAEGLDVFRIEVPEALRDRTLAECGVREGTGCTIVALRDEQGVLRTNPPPATRLVVGREMILVGDEQSQSRFLAKFVDD